MYSLDSYRGDKKATSIRGLMSGIVYPQCKAMCPMRMLLRLIKIIKSEKNILLNFGIITNNKKVTPKNTECISLGENRACGLRAKSDINAPK
jgi:hypothetical protein